MTSLALTNLIIESLTPSVNAPLLEPYKAIWQKKKIIFLGGILVIEILKTNFKFLNFSTLSFAFWQNFCQ